MNACAFGGRPLVAALSVFMLCCRPAAAAGDPVRGGYLFAAAGCAGCHTDVKNKGALLAGGRPLKTPFGTFYGPNITPHPEAGIGRWSDADFIRALRHGVSPSGEHYFPAFPFPSFTGMTDADMRDLKAYIFTLPAVDKPSRPHDLLLPFRWRGLLGAWKWMFFTPGPHRGDPARPARWNRGAYLVRAVVHCGECHTPRNRLGAMDGARWLAGNPDGPDGEAVPNITPDRDTGIGKWSAEEIALFLETGEDPTVDFAGSFMAEVIDDSTSKLSAADRGAIVTYLRSLAPIRAGPKK